VSLKSSPEILYDPTLVSMFCELTEECSVDGYKEIDSVYVPDIDFIFGP
jgi:hypothetical protein